jgi:hypothetical protein
MGTKKDQGLHTKMFHEIVRIAKSRHIDKKPSIKHLYVRQEVEKLISQLEKEYSN